MRVRHSEAEYTSFQEAGPYRSEIDIQTDVAIIYGLNATFEERLEAWTRAGYRPHVMTGVAWGQYQDYVRGEWDGTDHHDDAQMASGPFPLEHGISQGHDVYYMVPTLPYVEYLKGLLYRVVDGGAIAIHLEEPEFWVRGGYSPSFKTEWQAFYDDPWQDPTSSPDARYKCARLKQHLYARAIDILTRALKEYATEKGMPDFKCYVPTHSLLNYAHWRIVSPEAKLLPLETCDGIIAQTWTGTARTPNVYRGIRKERTFETAYCEYASAAALVRNTDFRLWLLSDPIEDNPIYAWPDYRRNWECTVTASLFFPETARFEVTPWPSRVFLRSYPRENLREKPLIPLLEGYMARLEREGEAQQLSDAREAFDRLMAFYEERREQGGIVETLGFADSAEAADEIRFGDVLRLSSAFYRHLHKLDPENDVRLRQAIARFYVRPTVDRETIPADYATELMVVFNALADMAWDKVEWQNESPGVYLAITDTMMFQRGEPAPSDPDMSFVYGLALPLLKHGVPLGMVYLERVADPGYMDDVKVLMLTYEGMKPPSPEVHETIAEWVREGGKLILFGRGDAYNAVHEWWNQGTNAYACPQNHLLELLEWEDDPANDLHEVGKGAVLFIPASPSALAQDAKGADQVWEAMNGITDLAAQSALIMRRGPYVIAAGLDEAEDEGKITLPGTYIDLYDAGLAVLIDPVIESDTRHLLIDVSRADPDHAWVLAASGRVEDEIYAKDSLTCTIRSAADTIMVMRAVLPREPISVASDDTYRINFSWHPDSRTIFVTGKADPAGVPVEIRF